MPAEVRLRLRLPPDLTADEVRAALCEDGVAFVPAGGASDGHVSPLYSDTGTLVEIGLLVVNVPMGVKYLIDLLSMVRRRGSDDAGQESALIVDGARYDLSSADAHLLRELLE